MTMRLLQWLDTHLVHHRWEWHWLNVLRPALRWMICEPFERRILASAPDDFYVEDEPLADVIAAFERGEKHLTAPPSDEFAELDITEEEFDAMAAAAEPIEIVVPNGFRCNHMSAFIGGAAHSTSVPEFGCGCKPQPVFR